MKNLVLWAIVLNSVFTPVFAAANSESRIMDFDQCKAVQKEMGSTLSGSQYKVISIVKTNIASVQRFCVNDGSVLVTCSKPDHKMVVTQSTNRKGC